MDSDSNWDKKSLSAVDSFSSVVSDFPDSLQRHGSHLSCVPPLPPLPPVTPPPPDNDNDTRHRVESFEQRKTEELEGLYKLQAKLGQEGTVDVEREAEIQSQVSVSLFATHASSGPYRASGADIFGP